MTLIDTALLYTWRTDHLACIGCGLPVCGVYVRCFEEAGPGAEAGSLDGGDWGAGGPVVVGDADQDGGLFQG